MHASKDRSLRWAFLTGDVCAPARLAEMTSFFSLMSSPSCCFPKSSVLSSDMRPPPAPPDAPLETMSPPTPPEPPDPPDPPDPQSCLSSGNAHTRLRLLLLPHLPGVQQVNRSELPPFPPPRPVSPGRKSAPPFLALPSPCRSSSSRRHRLLLTLHSSGVILGFPCLGQWVGCLLGQKLRDFLMGLMIPTLSPLLSTYRSLACFVSLDTIRLKHKDLLKPRFMFSFIISRSACSSSASVTILSLPFPQVRSYSSFSDSSTLGSYWMRVEREALTLWNLDLLLTLSMNFDPPGSTFVLSDGTLAAVCRPFTAICSPLTTICSPFTAVCSSFPGFILDIGNIKIGLLPLWHIGLTLLMSIHPVNLVGFSSVEYVPKGFVPFIRMGIYGFVDVAWEAQSLVRAEPPHFGTRRQVLFPKFPLVWSGLDDQASPVLKGSSSRLMALSALVAKFVTLWVALDAVTREAFGIVLFRSPLVFVVELYFQSISILPYCSVLSSFSCIVILYFTFVMAVIPPHLSEVET